MAMKKRTVTKHTTELAINTTTPRNVAPDKNIKYSEQVTITEQRAFAYKQAAHKKHINIGVPLNCVSPSPV
jgi:hypothetical protein